MPFACRRHWPLFCFLALCCRTASGEVGGLRGALAAVECSSGAAVPSGSRSDITCSGNECCPEYGRTFPCPAADEAWVADGHCDMAALQLWPNSSTYAAPPLQPQARIPPVSLSPDAALSEVLETQSGVANVQVLSSQDEGFEEAFRPPVVGSETWYTDDAYPGLWGDLGPAMQPGFGGLRTYNVVKFAPSPEKPLQLFRVMHWAPGDKSSMCSIWWGFESAFATNFVQASINAALCNEYSAIMQCNLTWEVTAIVGQGWDLSSEGFMERGCSSTAGVPQTWVARNLTNQGFPPPGADKLQVVLPACQLSEIMDFASCKACPLPSGAALQNVSNIASYVTNPPDPDACVTDLLDLEAKFTHHGPADHHR